MGHRKEKQDTRAEAKMLLDEAVLVLDNSTSRQNRLIMAGGSE